MNVPVPLSDNAFGFIIVIFIALIASCTLTYIFWRKHMF